MLQLEVGKMYFYPKINHFVRVVDIMSLSTSTLVFWKNEDKNCIRNKDGVSNAEDFLHDLEASEMNHGFEQLRLTL